MFRARIGSPSYLGVGVAIATGLATSLASSPQARAQDLNLQTQLNIFSPPVTVVPLASTGKQSALSTLKNCSSPHGNPRLASFLKENSDLMEFLKENPDLTIDDLATRSNRFQERFNEFKRRHPSKNAKRLEEVKTQLATFPTNFCYLVQLTTFKTTFQFNPTYETDVLKKGDNSSAGTSAGFGGNFLLTTAGLRPFDLIALGAGETSVRYGSPFASASVDSASSQLFYQAFLHGSGYFIDPLNNQAAVPVDDVLQYAEQHKIGSLLSSGLITSDTIGFGLQNQTAFTPTFHMEKADLLTPQVTLARQNINLDGPDPVAIAKCANATTGFCHYADLSLTVGQTFSDVLSQQNFNVAGSAAISWRIDEYWKLALNTMATGKDYEDFVGGRQDLLLQAGPALTYTYANGDVNFTFQLPVTYFKNYSTASAAAWTGLVVQPTLTVAFSYTAPSASLPR
jgi:hypothetical protein